MYLIYLFIIISLIYSVHCAYVFKRSICQISEHPGRHAFRGGGFKVGGGIFFFAYQRVTMTKATKMMGWGVASDDDFLA